MATTKRTLDGHGEENSLYRPHFPEHWERSDLHSLAKWVNGLAFRNIEFQPKGMPVIKIAEIKNGITEQTKFTLQEFDESVRVSPGDMLFSWSGQPESSIDVSRWLGPEGWLNQHIFRVTVDPGVEEDFFYYLLKYLNPNFVSIARNKQTTGLGHVTKKDLEQIEVALPVPSEQQAIAHILGTLDDKIELNRRMNRTLEEMAHTIFQDWFVDFGPVRAKMEGQDPYLPTELWDLFPANLVDSELGEIPEGWEVKPLDHLVTLNPKETMKKGIEAPYLDMASLLTDGCYPGKPVTRGFNSGSRFRNGDTLLARITPCLENGKTAYVHCLPNETTGWGSTEFMVMRGIPPTSPEYTYLLARNQSFRSHAILSMTGTSGRQRVQTEALATHLLPVPTEDAHDAFASTVQPLFRRIEANREEMDTLTAQRDALLPGLVSGRVSVTSV